MFKIKNEILLSISEASKVFGIKQDTLRKLVKRGNISSVKRGKHCYVYYSRLKIRCKPIVSLDNCKDAIEDFSEMKKTAKGKPEKKGGFSWNGDIKTLRDKQEASLAMTIEQIRKIRRNNEDQEQKYISVDTVEIQIRILFSVLYEEMSKFMGSLSKKISKWRILPFDNSEFEQIKRDFLSLLYDAEKKAYQIIEKDCSERKELV